MQDSEKHTIKRRTCNGVGVGDGTLATSFANEEAEAQNRSVQVPEDYFRGSA
jgi:hypothetical protein